MQSKNLTPAEFEAHIKDGTFRLSFVGMSNAGKSYRSKTLNRERGFLWHQVDADIQKDLGFAAMDEISSWLGYPTSPTYPEHEAEYLRFENKATLLSAEQTHGKNLVFDTTGSVVHLETKTLEVLKENCLVIHLDVGDDSLQKMMERFFKEPKPVAWCGFFSQEVGETEVEALVRCYPTLLAERLTRYRKLAHLNIPAKDVYDTTGEETLEVIKSYLR